MSLPEGDVLYQLYPVTFADANGDGNGDFEGIRQRLPYLQNQLGVDGIWMGPHYESPWQDGGYDVSDYFSPNEKLHGSRQDLQRMLAEARQRDIDVVADFVPSHSSDQHPWFQGALQDPSDTRYIFVDGEEPRNNWLSVFPHHDEISAHPASAWRSVREYWPHAHPKRLGQSVLTSFAPHQPNWNHQNPDVQGYLYRAMRFGLKQGFSGFRVDAVDFMDHDRTYQDEKPNRNYKPGGPINHSLERRRSARGENVHAYLAKLAGVLDEFPGAYLMLESYPDRDTDYADPIGHYRHHYDYFGQRWPGRIAPFCFELTDLEWKAPDFKTAIDSFQETLKPGDIPVYPSGNHDKQRTASRFGEEAAQAAAVMQLTLPGVIIVYQGEELGMTNHRNIPLKMRTDSYLERDVSRSPLPMHARDPRAGYSEAPIHTFRLPIHPEFRRFNVESQLADPDSTLNLYRRALSLRRETTTLRHGSYTALDTSNNNVFGFARSLKDHGERYITLVNFLPEATTLNIGNLTGNSRVVLSTDRLHEDKILNADITLEPHQAVVLRPQA